MAISKERKVWAVVLLVAGAGLAVDRGFFGITGAKPVQAAEISATASGSKPEAKQAPVAPASITLSARLKQLGEIPRNVDLLEGTLQRVALVAAEGEAPKPVQEDARKLFATSHHLSAVVSMASGSNAIVNGRAVSVGEELEGFRLVEVTRETAVFEGTGGKVELQLPGSR